MQKLVDDSFHGNASAAARACEVSNSYMWQLLGGHRGIGERSARDIEIKLALPHYALDGVQPLPSARELDKQVRVLMEALLRQHRQLVDKELRRRYRKPR